MLTGALNPLSESDLDQLEQNIALAVVDRLMTREEFSKHHNKHVVMQMARHFIFQVITLTGKGEMIWNE